MNHGGFILIVVVAVSAVGADDGNKAKPAEQVESFITDLGTVLESLIQKAATYEELRQAIDKRPGLDSESKRELLRRIEKTPKVYCNIDAVTVYSDGIVCHGTLSTELSFDCRLSLLGRSFSPLCKARLADEQKNAWVVPPLKWHYSYIPLEKAWTLLIPCGRRVCFTHVETRESPRPVRLKPLADGKVEKPPSLRYSISCYSSAHTADLGKQEDVYFIGRGKARVDWKDTPVPSSVKTGILKKG